MEKLKDTTDVELEQLNITERKISIETDNPKDQQHHVHFQQPSAFEGPNTVTEKCMCDSDKNWYYTVTIQGKRTRPAIVTLHDIGLDAELCFGGFFNFPEMMQLREHFCVYHLTIMGQESNAPTIPDNVSFPSLSDLADMIGSVCGQYQIQHFVGIAVGVGANIMARFAYNQKSMVDALCFVNCISTAAGWGEWSSQMVGGWMNSLLLRRRDSAHQHIEYLMWHYFNRNQERYPDIVSSYRIHFTDHVNAENLYKFMNAYAQRTDIGINRELMIPSGKIDEKAMIITAPTLLVASQWSPHYDEAIAMNARMQPDRTEFMQVSNADGAVLEEYPDKVAQALVLHLQGCGFVSQFFRNRKYSDRGDY